MTGRAPRLPLNAVDPDNGGALLEHRLLTTRHLPCAFVGLVVTSLCATVVFLPPFAPRPVVCWLAQAPFARSQNLLLPPPPQLFRS